MSESNQSAPWLQLMSVLKTIGYLQSSVAMLHWDQSTYMPKAGVATRGEQIAALELVVHHKMTGTEFQKLLGHFVDLSTGEIFTHNHLGKREKALIRELFRDYQKATLLPDHFIAKRERLLSESMFVWEQSKAKDDFQAFSPYLQKIIAMKKEEAHYFAPTAPHQKSLYGVLLDQFEPFLELEQLKKTFTEVKSFTINLLRQIQRSSYYLQEPQITGPFPRSLQIEVSHELLKLFKADLSRLRLDESAHPFSQGFHPSDVRITTKYDEENLFDSLFSTLHEMGHAFYELGLDPEWFGTPLGQYLSMGMHESQSRFWENVVGRSYSFWELYYPKLQKKFPQQLKQLNLDECYRMVNTVRPTFIRTVADEVTYNLHILIRFEIEQKMIDGDVKIEELPELWNHLYEEFLGIRPTSMQNGILQDIHWSGGMIGYFPTYTLGNLYCSQFTEALRHEFTDFDSLIRKGDFEPFLTWLNKHLFNHGREKNVHEILSAATRKPFSSIPFMNYLQQKYLYIYN